MDQLSRPEEIIKGNDAVSVQLLRQIYSALKDRSPENLDLMERCWVHGIEKVYTNRKDFDHILLESILNQAIEILNTDKSWDNKKDQFYSMLEQFVFLKAREEVFKDFFDHVESVIANTMQLDYNSKVPLSTITTGEKANILNYAASMLNMLVESMQTATVSVKAFNTALQSQPGVMVIIADKDGIIRFVSDLGEKLLSIQHGYLIGDHISSILINYPAIEKKWLLRGKQKTIRTEILLKGYTDILIKGQVTQAEGYKNYTEIEELVYSIQFTEDFLRKHLPKSS
ncbi:MAG: hypothetical protein MUF42_17260 [Cytophagaceae bacterium]|jgi:hypothetical protein|nr:hypothetical protein [Cytophagaceae bacterium]